MSDTVPGLTSKTSMDRLLDHLFEQGNNEFLDGQFILAFGAQIGGKLKRASVPGLYQLRHAIGDAKTGRMIGMADMFLTADIIVAVDIPIEKPLIEVAPPISPITRL